MSAHTCGCFWRLLNHLLDFDVTADKVDQRAAQWRSRCAERGSDTHAETGTFRSGAMNEDRESKVEGPKKRQSASELPYLRRQIFRQPICKSSGFGPCSSSRHSLTRRAQCKRKAESRVSRLSLLASLPPCALIGSFL